MNATLELLKQGIHRFQTEVYPQNAETYKRAAKQPQKPHTLIITCADSRIDPEAITQSGPGDVFVTRNIGNMVPAYGEMLGGVSAVIEYAVAGLDVKHIVVCGHSDCGAMKALLHPESTAKMPTVSSWLTNGKAALMVSDALRQADEPSNETLRRVTKQNVLMQLAHLKTHPSVAGAMAQGKVSTSGWIYDIATGDVSIIEEEPVSFQTVER